MPQGIDAVIGDVTPDKSVAEEYEAAVKEEPAAGEEGETDKETSPPSETEEKEPQPEVPEKRERDYKVEYENLSKALKEERRVSKEHREKFIADQAALEARFNERLQMVIQGIQAEQQKLQQSPPIEPPNAEDDPIGYMNWKLAEQEKEIARLTDYTTSQENQQRQGAALQQEYGKFMGNYVNNVQEFSKETPDFAQAYKFAWNIKDRELEALGNMDPQSRAVEIKKIEFDIVYRALASGQNPAQAIYNYAKHYGYGKAALEPTKVTEAPSLDKDKAKAAAAQSIGKLSSGSPAGSLTAQQLLEMDDDEIVNVDWGKVLKY